MSQLTAHCNPPQKATACTSSQSCSLSKKTSSRHFREGNRSSWSGFSKPMITTHLDNTFSKASTHWCAWMAAQRTMPAPLTGNHYLDKLLWECIGFDNRVWSIPIFIPNADIILTDMIGYIVSWWVVNDIIQQVPGNIQWFLSSDEAF